MESDDFDLMLAQFEELEAQLATNTQTIEAIEVEQEAEIFLNQEPVAVKTEETVQEEFNIPFNAIKKLLEEIYPDRWDIIDNFDFISSTPNKTILIKFQDIKMTNSYNYKYTLKNLYVAITFFKNQNNEFTFYNMLYGARESVTYAEYSSNYRHSHVRTGHHGFGDFCVGSGTEMSDLLMDLSSEFNIVKFEAFLYQLEDYLAWESLEGVPFYRMSNIMIRTSNQYNNPSYADCKRALIKFIDTKIKDSGYILPTSLVQSENTIQVKINDRDEGYLLAIADCTDKHKYRDPSGLYVNITSSGNHAQDIININYELNQCSGFKFKDTIVKYKIEDLNIQETEQVVRTKYADPSITNYITGALVNWINDYYNNIEHL